MLREFRDFAMRGNIIDLAVAVVIGAAFGAVVAALVDGVLMPIIAAIVGKPSFNDLTISIGDAKILYGSVLSALITFLAVAAAVFFFVVKPIATLQKRLGMVKEPAPVKECPECLTSIPAAATRCAACTAQQPVAI